MESGARAMKSWSTLSSMRSTSSTNLGSRCHSSHVSKFTDARQQTAVRVSPCWSRPVGSRISLHRFDWRTFKTRRALMRRELAVRGVDEQQVRLPGLQPRLEDLLPQRSCADALDDLARVRAAQRERLVVAHGEHELVRHAHAVVQVQALAVEIAGRLADLDEFLDLGVVHVEIHGRRAAA